MKLGVSSAKTITYISNRKEKNKQKGEIKDIVALMCPSMNEYFRNQRSPTSLR